MMCPVSTHQIGSVCHFHSKILPDGPDGNNGGLLTAAQTKNRKMMAQQAHIAQDEEATEAYEEAHELNADETWTVSRILTAMTMMKPAINMKMRRQPTMPRMMKNLLMESSGEHIKTASFSCSL